MARHWRGGTARLLPLVLAMGVAVVVVVVVVVTLLHHGSEFFSAALD
jgi:hypothetical protein